MSITYNFCIFIFENLEFKQIFEKFPITSILVTILEKISILVKILDKFPF